MQVFILAYFIYVLYSHNNVRFIKNLTGE